MLEIATHVVTKSALELLQGYPRSLGFPISTRVWPSFAENCSALCLLVCAVCRVLVRREKCLVQHQEKYNEKRENKEKEKNFKTFQSSVENGGADTSD